ncbi:hypothetical protein [Nocardia vinacea]|uniref:hypothetical protein n=1 Tax=Nocardia vinacea TaxID=96468 RepID=UPI0003112CE4|nr:hypothetical protein [Nocardia vinacea]
MIVIGDTSGLVAAFNSADPEHVDARAVLQQAALTIVSPRGGRIMRLDILDRGYRPGTKLLFTLIQVFSGQPIPDTAKLVFHRLDFYGARAKTFTHEAMRRPSAWSVADRELMAAFVSNVKRMRIPYRCTDRDRRAGVRT